MELRLGELFCGPGGLALGAMRAGFAHAWAVDNDPDACATYLRNIPGAHADSVICADVRQYPLESLPEIDCLAFGFPCNDFSMVGEKKGLNGSYGPLFGFGVRVLRSHQPLCFVAENVGGLRGANEGTAFDLILGEMESAGYRVTPHLYRAEEYGVPQRRRRWIIVGVRKDADFEFRIPAPTTKGHPVTAREALESPPIAADATNHELMRSRARVVERLERIAPGENAFTANLPEHLQIKTRTTISQIYRRLHPDRPAYTVTGSGGGGTHIYHWHEPRALTNRERARLQSFPDDFVFEGTRDSVRRQIGMAVPSVLAEAVLRAVRESVDRSLVAAAG